MKTKLHFKFLATLLFILTIPIFSAAQKYNATKTLNKSAAVPSNVIVDITNHSGDLRFVTTNENMVQIKTEIEISGNTENEVNEIIKAIESFQFEQNRNKFEIDTRFYKSMNSINNRNTITLLNGNKVKIREFNIRHEIHIPESAGLNLNNKYSDIEMQSVNGDSKITLYSSKLNAQNFSGELTMVSKYSKITLGEIEQKADFDFYDSDIEFKSCADANIQSKYSKFEAEKTGELVIQSYDDKFIIDECSRLNLNAKYSDFISNANVSEIHLDLYDCNLEINSANTGTYKGKYSDLKFGDIKEIDIPQSYDDNFYFGKTSDINISESKYSEYEIKEASELKLNGYNDNVLIENLKTNFSGISMTGKYGKLDVNTGGADFQVYFNIKYPKIDIPESVKIIKQVENNSELELIGNNSGSKITVEGYDMKVKIE